MSEKQKKATGYQWLKRIFVGVAGFEPAASCSQSRRDNRATLHPENGCKYTGFFRVGVPF